MRLAYRGARLVWFVTRPRAEGALVVVWHAGRVLVIRNSYRSYLSAPAGNLRRGETPADGAVRELCEEVGIAVPAERLRFVREVVHGSDYREDHSHVFEIELEAPPELAPDGREVVWADFLRPEEALACPLSVPLRAYLEEWIRARR
jgi:8-oxo-dGTP pyrophosphatase MutT (NUDIX family)